MIRGIHHVAVSTADIERSLQFYRDLLGATVVFDAGWPEGTELADTVTRLKNSSCKQIMLLLGNAYIELFQYATPEPASLNPDRPVCDHGITHLCFDVTDLDSEYRRLKESGVDTHSEPQWVSDSVKTLYARDPDGNVVEFQEILANTNDEAAIGVPQFVAQ